MWIVDQVINNEDTVANLAYAHDIKPFTIRQWVCRTKKGHLLRSRMGRPRLLDDDSMQSIRDVIDSNLGIGDESLKALIRSQYDTLRKKSSPTTMRPSIITLESNSRCQIAQYDEWYPILEKLETNGEVD